MKLKLLTIAILLCALVGSCKDDTGDDLSYTLADHSTNYVFSFVIQDVDGNNLLDAQTENAVDIGQITITLNGTQYRLADTKPADYICRNPLSMFYGAYCTESEQFGTVIHFGELDFYGRPELKSEQSYYLTIGDHCFEVSTRFDYDSDTDNFTVDTSGLNPEDSPYRIILEVE